MMDTWPCIPETHFQLDGYFSLETTWNWFLNSFSVFSEVFTLSNASSTLSNEGNVMERQIIGTKSIKKSNKERYHEN